jgi:hypothetical protein
VLYAVHVHRRHPHSRACHLTLSVAPPHGPLSLRGVQLATRTHGGVGERVKPRTRVVRRPVAASHLFRVGSRGVRSVVTRCSHQLYRCREGCRRAAWVGERGALVFAPWGGKCAANPSDRDRASEACCGGMIDQYVGRIVHVSVPGCRPPPPLNLTRLGVWGAAQVVSLIWWRTWRWIQCYMMRLELVTWRR